MRSTNASYLVDKSHLRQKAVTLRIPQHIHSALGSMRARADAAGFVFDVQAVVVEALERALERVEGELAAVEAGEASGKLQLAKARRARRGAKPVVPAGEALPS